MGIYPQCALLFRQYDMKMEFYPLSDELAVAGQLRAQDMAQVAQAGFKSVVINRPDQEEGPWQPSSKEVIEAAQAAGMQAVYQPVVSGHLTLEDAETFLDLLNTLPKPILAYCRSGGRCTSLFHAAQTLQDRDEP